MLTSTPGVLNKKNYIFRCCVSVYLFDTLHSPVTIYALSFSVSTDCAVIKVLCQFVIHSWHWLQSSTLYHLQKGDKIDFIYFYGNTIMSNDVCISNWPLCRLVDILELLSPRNIDSLHCVNMYYHFPIRMLVVTACWCGSQGQLWPKMWGDAKFVELTEKQHKVNK